MHVSNLRLLNAVILLRTVEEWLLCLKPLLLFFFGFALFFFCLRLLLGLSIFLTIRPGKLLVKFLGVSHILLIFLFVIAFTRVNTFVLVHVTLFITIRIIFLVAFRILLFLNWGFRDFCLTICLCFPLRARNHWWTQEIFLGSRFNCGLEFVIRWGHCYLLLQHPLLNIGSVGLDELLLAFPRHS